MLEVQRLLGRCLLRIQQYEKLLRVVVANYEFGGPASEAEKAQRKKRRTTAKATLGTLVQEFFGQVVAGGDEQSTSWTELDEAAVSRGEAVIKIRFGIVLEAADRKQMKADIKTLVKLRNMLVHFFIDQHDLRTEEGCKDAAMFLSRCVETIGTHHQRLFDLVSGMDEARAKAADFLTADKFAEIAIGLAVGPDDIEEVMFGSEVGPIN